MPRLLDWPVLRVAVPPKLQDMINIDPLEISHGLKFYDIQINLDPSPSLWRMYQMPDDGYGERRDLIAWEGRVIGGTWHHGLVGRGFHIPSGKLLNAASPALVMKTHVEWETEQETWED